MTMERSSLTDFTPSPELTHANPDEGYAAWTVPSEVRTRMTQLHFEVEEVIRHFRSLAPSGPDKRRLPRHPFPHAIDLWPVEKGRPTGERIIVIGKQISLGGLDFFHREPLAQRHVVVALEPGSHRSIYVLAELNWCRFIRDGWYDGGGRFQKIVGNPRDWD